MHRSLLILLSLAVYVTILEAQIIIGGGVLVGAALFGGLALLKGALLGAALSRRGGGRRGGGHRQRGYRDVALQEEEEANTLAALEVVEKLDINGCIMKLLCMVEATPDDQLSTEQLIVKQAFYPGNSTSKVKGLKPSFDVAASFGARLANGNAKLCDKIYDACPLPQEQLLDQLQESFTCTQL